VVASTQQLASLSATPPSFGNVAGGSPLKGKSADWMAENVGMFKSNSAKLMVYASEGLPSRERLASVRQAAKETAKRLNLDFELVRFERTDTPIYVYYEDSEGEPIPLYCDEGKISGLDEISNALRRMMFVLSFHPKHPALAQMRSELLKFS
jgi:hypothetical protein